MMIQVMIDCDQEHSLTTILDSSSMELPVGGEVRSSSTTTTTKQQQHHHHNQGDTSSSCSGSSIELGNKSQAPQQVI